MKKYGLIVGALLYLAILNSCDHSEGIVTSPDKYFPEVKLIIENHCLTCHSSAGSWAGRPVAFDSDTSIAQQYTLIKAAIADPVTPFNKRMPQEGTLSASEIDIIIKWFDKGGKITD